MKVLFAFNKWMMSWEGNCQKDSFVNVSFIVAELSLKSDKIYSCNTALASS